jgi:hypothetical protein
MIGKQFIRSIFFYKRGGKLVQSALYTSMELTHSNLIVKIR